MRKVEPAQAGLRLDRWLWQARFFKSRSLAIAAVNAGHVRLNGARAKPAREVRVGDRLVVQRAGRVLECHVRSLPVRRGPPAEARLAYEETPESIERGRRHAEALKLGALAAPRPDGRPDKRGRRQLLALGRAQGEGPAGPHTDDDADDGLAAAGEPDDDGGDSAWGDSAWDEVEVDRDGDGDDDDAGRDDGAAGTDPASYHNPHADPAPRGRPPRRAR